MIRKVVLFTSNGKPLTKTKLNICIAQIKSEFCTVKERGKSSAKENATLKNIKVINCNNERKKKT